MPMRNGGVALMTDLPARSAAPSALLARNISTNGAPKKIHRKLGVKVTQVVSSPPRVPAQIGLSPPGAR